MLALGRASSRKKNCFNFEEENIVIGNSSYEAVQQFCYLGDMLSAGGGAEASSVTRTRCAWKKFRELLFILSSCTFSLEKKGSFYQAAVRPVLLYGSETWPVKEEDLVRLHHTEMSRLHWMSHATFKDRIPSKDLLTKFDLLPVRRNVQCNRLRWFGHVVRMDNDNWVKKCMTLEVYGIRDPGRSKKTWEKVITSDLCELGITRSLAQAKLEEDYCDEQSNPCHHGIIDAFKLIMTTMMMMMMMSGIPHLATSLVSFSSIGLNLQPAWSQFAALVSFSNLRGLNLQHWSPFATRRIYHHHHSFNVSVPLKVGRTAPMFVLSFFLHSILLAGSALDSFQCLRSLLIVSFHVFFGLPRPRCPTTSNSVMLLIQPSFLTTCPNQRSRLYLNKVCMLLIPSFLSRESELVVFQTHITCPPNHCSIITLQFKQVVDIGGPTLTGIQQDSADIRAVYLPTCDV